ncbi:hypothetical protein [Morganella psychrotolerans]|uniref:hypothetical protein n=1 Tax=Morganella psychrotolerans TaxID=368603 RepID=UPI000ADBFF38|nr:hypothetical protein [Morganella psychrotolerans]
MEQKDTEFEELIKPVMKYLAEKHHPHTSITVTSDRAELLESVAGFGTDEYLKD